MATKYTKELLENVCKNSYSYAEVLRKLGKKPGGGTQTLIKNKIKEYNIDISHFTGQLWNKGKTHKDDPRIVGAEKYNLDEVFCNPSYVTQKVLRGYVERHNIIEYKCQKCGCTGKWEDGIIALELHHIDGNNTNNTVENLEFLCPNCHALTDNFRGRNKNNEEKIQIESKHKKYCIDCGKEISLKAIRCKSCEAIHNNAARKVDLKDKPSRDELKEMIRFMSFLQIGNKYGISDNAIRKWCDTYNLPRTKKEINNYSDEEWKNI
jgi:hypothetical protein